MTVNIDGNGKIVEGSLYQETTDYNSPYAGDGTAVTISKETNGCVSVNQLNPTDFVFTSDQNNEIISNGRTFAQVLNGVMQYNKQNGTDFPVALAQDYLNGTSNAFSIVGLGSQAISIGGTSYRQVIATETWENRSAPEFHFFTGYGITQ